MMFLLHQLCQTIPYRVYKTAQGHVLSGQSHCHSMTPLSCMRRRCKRGFTAGSSFALPSLLRASSHSSTYTHTHQHNLSQRDLIHVWVETICHHPAGKHMIKASRFNRAAHTLRRHRFWETLGKVGSCA